MNIDWKEAYVMQWNLYVERAFGKSLVVKTGYVGNHAVGLPRNNVSPNEPPPGPGDVQARRPFQDIGVVTLRSTSGQSTYHGLEVEVQKRYSAGLSFISAYTWAKTLDNRSILDLWFGGSSKASLLASCRASLQLRWDLGTPVWPRAPLWRRRARPGPGTAGRLAGQRHPGAAHRLSAHRWNTG